MKTKINAQKIAIHTIMCIGFMLLPLIASPRSSVFDTFNFGFPEITGLINSALLICFFYFHYYFILPRFYYQKKYLQWIGITLLAFVIILLAPNYLTFNFHTPPEFHPSPDMFPRPHDQFHENSIFRSFRFEETLTKFLVVFVLSLLLRTREQWKKSQEEKKQAELSYLRSQVNPHFLFNTLNGIYSLALVDSKKTPDAIVKLSELMRYVISEINKDYVPLLKEIEHLQNYIELQRMRLGETVIINFEVSDISEKQLIVPLLLMPFVENAFKYGISSTSTSEINIQLTCENDKMKFLIKNNIEKISGKVVKNGTGLENVKKRLALLYPGNYELTLNSNENIYTAILILNLK